MVNLGILYKSLTDEDFKVLYALEKYIDNREYVPLQLLEKYSGLYEEKLQLILIKLHDLNIVKRETVSGNKMYRLTMLGYDMLAIRALARANIIEAIGDKIGVGKESEIYLGLAPGNIQVAVKLLRIGRISFRQTKRVRIWTREKELSWYKQSKFAAEREFKALKELVNHSSNVPLPLGYNRHAVVIEFIDGVELYKRPLLREPNSVLRQLLDTIAISYHKAQIVHGDLSEYNVLVRRIDEKPFIIDWPQYVYREDPTANELIRRDVYYIVRFFNKVYGTNLDPEIALSEVLSWKNG